MKRYNGLIMGTILAQVRSIALYDIHKILYCYGRRIKFSLNLNDDPVVTNYIVGIKETFIHIISSYCHTHNIFFFLLRYFRLNRQRGSTVLVKGDSPIVPEINICRGAEINPQRAGVLVFRPLKYVPIFKMCKIFSV